ncbi:MAG TPA: DUF2336 domain-containing protein [Stellaceae bacterium]|nr:DUF2336 domain-containing protein [Stellaceae bacterium]
MKEGLIQRVIRKVRGTERPLDYEETKQLVASNESTDRLVVARHSQTRPEALYYLASDKDPEVRAAVAANEATPVQADLVLARDRDDRVRVDLAQKIARLTPDLSAEQHQRMREMTYEVLEILVRDQVTRVRQVISEVLKDVANAPPEVIRTLARDSELVVAGPVLRFSPVLTDEDLLQIIQNAPIPGALAAIAQRAEVRARVADAIGESDDVEAITALLKNPSAQIREETLDRLLDRAPEFSAWHRPLVVRPWLPASAAKKLAGFVAQNLLSLLADRRDLDPQTIREVKSVVMQRLGSEASKPASELHDRPALAKKAEPDILDRARKLRAKGQLDESAVLAALDSDRALARAALAVLGELPLQLVERVLSAHSAKGITALAWKCGLSMRAAVKVQLMLGQIPPGNALQPRVDGRYPMNEEAMRWQLDFFSSMTSEKVAL